MGITNYILPDSFSATVRKFTETKGISQAEFSRRCLLSKTTASRIYRDTNDRGATYVPTINVVMAASIGLKLTVQESKDLLFSAFPEIEFWEHFLSNNLTIDDANEILFDLGVNTIGHLPE